MIGLERGGPKRLEVLLDCEEAESAGGAYVNFMMDEDQDRVQASYRDNYQRLAELKKEYDPGNLFPINQNIQPAD
jgi:FAD/FMN-containing dehydrogenase